MSKLSLEALKMRAEAVASEDLLATISGGTENACHDDKPAKTPCDHLNDVQGAPRPTLTPLGEAILRWWHDCD